MYELRPISTKENFPQKENVENFQLLTMIFSENFVSVEIFLEWKRTFTHCKYQDFGASRSTKLNVDVFLVNGILNIFRASYREQNGKNITPGGGCIKLLITFLITIL